MGQHFVFGWRRFLLLLQERRTWFTLFVCFLLLLLPTVSQEPTSADATFVCCRGCCPDVLYSITAVLLQSSGTGSTCTLEDAAEGIDCFQGAMLGLSCKQIVYKSSSSWWSMYWRGYEIILKSSGPDKILGGKLIGNTNRGGHDESWSRSMQINSLKSRLLLLSTSQPAVAAQGFGMGCVLCFYICRKFVLIFWAL